MEFIQLHIPTTSNSLTARTRKTKKEVYNTLESGNNSNSLQGNYIWLLQVQMGSDPLAPNFQFSSVPSGAIAV